jgi:hypothetical protein
MKQAIPRLRIAMTLLFAAELAAGVAALFLYDGAMSIGFLVTLPLLGFLQSIMMFKREAPRRLKLFVALQAMLFLLPPIVYAGFQPNVSYEEAVDLVRSHRQDDAEPIADGGKRYVTLEGVSNPFISRGYVIVVPDRGTQVEYIVNPVSGKVTELK